jgi:hypothetical protein
MVSTKSGNGKLSMAQMTRDAFRNLGVGATSAEIRSFVKERFGVQMKVLDSTISTSRADVKREIARNQVAPQQQEQVVHLNGSAPPATRPIPQAASRSVADVIRVVRLALEACNGSKTLLKEVVDLI